MTRTFRLLTIALAVSGLMLSACGDDDESDASATPTGATSGVTGTPPGGDSWLADAQAAAEQATTMPTEINAAALGPVEVTEGLSVYFVACDQSIPGCVSQVDGFTQAAEAVGVDVEVCDAKFDVAAFQNCMSIAVQAQPDAIVNNARPVADAPEAYADAHAAGITMIGQFTSELPNPETGNTVEVGYVCEQEGEILGNYIVATSEGEANTVMFADTVYRCNQQRAAGVQAAFDDCPTCSLEVISYSAGTAQTDLPPAIQAALQANPDLNWIVGTPGFAGTMAADAVRQAGKADSISVATFDGDEPELALLRAGDIVTADVLSGIHENGWTVMDAILRVKAGQEVPDGISNPTQMLFTEGNVPDQGSYEGAEGFREQFKELWGVS
jgi:ribose transport system substrate-binding protein